MLAASKTLHTRVRRSVSVHGATILMPRHVQLARLGCRGPGTPQTPEKRVMVNPKTLTKKWQKHESRDEGAGRTRLTRGSRTRSTSHQSCRAGSTQAKRCFAKGKRRQSQLRQLKQLRRGPETLRRDATRTSTMQGRAGRTTVHEVEHTPGLQPVLVCTTPAGLQQRRDETRLVRTLLHVGTARSGGKGEGHRRQHG